MAGRPPLFETPEALQAKIDEYFVWIKGVFHEEFQTIAPKYNGKGVPPPPERIKVKVWDRDPEPPTITGLTLHLGFAARQSLLDYMDRGDEFSDMVKRAKTRVEHGYEMGLFGQSPTGAIFALKNMGWADKQDVKHSGELKIDKLTVELISSPVPVASNERDVIK